MNTSIKDLYWVIAFATLALIAIITFWLGGKGNEIVSYFSFASALVLIVLAMVAIVYSFIHILSSQQNIGEMKTLVSEASRIMTEKAGTLADQAASMEQVVGQLLQSPATKRTTTTPSAGEADVSVPFSLVATSDLTRLFAFFLLKSYTLKKLLPIEQFVLLVKPLVKMSLTQLNSHTFGIFLGMACCLKGRLNEEKTSVQLSVLPSNFKDHLERQAAIMKKRRPELADYLDQIDNIK